MLFAEERQLIGAAVVLQHGAGIGLAGFGGELLEICHNAGHVNLCGLFFVLALGNEIAHVGHLAVAEVLNLEAVAVQRVGAQVHSHQLLFLLQHFHDVHLPFKFGHGGAFRLHFLHVSEQGNAAGEGVLLEQFSVAHQLVYEEVSSPAGLEIHAAFVAQAVQGSGEHQIFKTLAVHAAGHPFHEVVNI